MSRVLTATATIAVGALAATAPGAGASTTNSLRALGIRASVPMRATPARMAAGARITIRVTPSKRRGRALVRASLTQAAAADAPSKQVAGGRKRRGTISLRIPATGATRFRLAVSVKGRTYRTTIERTTPPPTPTPAPAPAPAPDGCGPRADGSYPSTGTPSASLTAATATVHPNDVARFVLRNTTVGDVCLRTGRAGTWQQLVDGAWVAAPPYPEGVVPPGSTAELLTIAPGQDLELGDVVPAHFPAGHYRLVQALDAPPAIAAFTATAELDVVP